jgi:catechol 2,3-dioxygenase-like lactoylglutathione lyase family enzyme
MIDHVSVPVRDLLKAAGFYDAVLVHLKMTRLIHRDATIGYGRNYPEFWLNHRPEITTDINPGGHICLRAPSATAVREFHAAALARGAIDEGSPGDRIGAMTTYFGAFIIDPDGNKLEVVHFPGPKP